MEIAVPDAEAPAFEPPEGNAAISQALGLSGMGSSGIPDEAIDEWAFGPDAFLPPGWRDGEGQPADPGGSVPRAVIDWVDAHLPVGIGVAGSLDLGAALGIAIGAGGSVTIVNQGGGWLEVEASGHVAVGAGAGLGAVAGDTGAEAEIGGELGPKGTRTFRVPWTRLADLGTLAKLGGSAVLGELMGAPAEAVLPSRLVETLVGGHDLTPFLMGERIEGVGSVSLGAEGGLLGEELGAVATGNMGVAVAVSYEDLADESGRRRGDVRFEGSMELLCEVAVDLSKTLGIDTTCVLPQITGSGALVVPFTEVDGDKDFEMPYVELALDGAVGPIGVGGKASLGPEHAGLEVHAELDPGSLLWQKVLDDAVGCALELATLGLVELETSGSMTLGLEVELDHPLLPEAASLARDVYDWVATGRASDFLADHLDVVQKVIDGADLSLGVDLTVVALHAKGSLKAKNGIEESLDGEAEIGLVYQRDDVLEALETPPTVSEALAMVRGGEAA